MNYEVILRQRTELLTECLTFFFFLCPLGVFLIGSKHNFRVILKQQLSGNVSGFEVYHKGKITVS